MAKAKAKSKKSWKTPQNQTIRTAQIKNPFESIRHFISLIDNWHLFFKILKEKNNWIGSIRNIHTHTKLNKNTHIHIPTLSKEKHGNFKILLVLSCNLKLLLLCTNIQFYNYNTQHIYSIIDFVSVTKRKW